MPLQQTSGAASYDAFGGGAAAVPNYIEDVFQVWLSTGNGTSRTVTGPDMTKGGLSITKSRSGTTGWRFVDTVRGAGLSLESNSTAAQATESTGVTAFTTTGTSIGADADYNTNGATYVDYLLKEQPKFFDVVTFTTGTSLSTNRRISHSLGSVPGCILVKRTTGAQSWLVYHRSTGRNAYLLLDTTEASTSFTNAWGTSDPTSTDFGINEDSLCFPSSTYVAYLFAHNAGGFGLSGTDNVISCGSFTTDGSGNATVNLGYEPQWVMIKRTSSTGNWTIVDNMRGLRATTNTQALLFPDRANAETQDSANGILPTATGFVNDATYLGGSNTYIYIAIRRGPMKVPTTGTSVFYTSAPSGLQTPEPAPFPVDLAAFAFRSAGGAGWARSWFDRLRGSLIYLATSSTDSEVNDFNGVVFGSVQNGYTTGSWFTGGDNARWSFRRAPGFFDEVCYTGDSTNPRSISHNLTVAPTLIITKKRNSTSNWITGFDFASTTYKYFFLNDSGAANPDTYASTPVYGGNPTASVFIVGNQGNMNISGDTYVSYLFASAPGVSKVGSYTGTGTTQTINCGFTGGARFVLIKRTDSTGDWYVWDSARGIVSGNDPYLLLNSTAAEVTSTDFVDTAATGFELSSTAPAALNASGGTYIFLAIA